MERRRPICSTRRCLEPPCGSDRGGGGAVPRAGIQSGPVSHSARVGESNLPPLSSSPARERAEASPPAPALARRRRAESTRRSRLGAGRRDRPPFRRPAGGGALDRPKVGGENLGGLGGPIGVGGRLHRLVEEGLQLRLYILDLKSLT